MLDAGHIISEYNGESILENLKPICKSCNCSMGSKIGINMRKSNFIFLFYYYE